MQAAFRCGIKPAEFWQMTPAELMVCIEIHREQEEARQQEVIFSAWLTAAYTRCKKLPDINQVLRRTEHREMTDDEMLEHVKLLNAMLGGEVSG